MAQSGGLPSEGGRSRGLMIVSGVLLAVALVLFARLTIFMVDPSRTSAALFPFSDWDSRHSCVSAYFVAAQAAGEGRNVYDDGLYSLPADPGAMRRARTLGYFKVDVYEYPPPFLLLPRALRLLAPEFLAFRLLWFILNALVVAVALLVVARSMDEPHATRALLFAPLVLAAVPMFSALQKGNLQLVVVALSMLGMVLIERGRAAAGGLLLAYATASKLFPGLLILYLLVRRQWRALAWTAGWGVVLTLATLADLGWGAMREFFDHLPRLLSGEAFPAFRNPGAMANNFSIPGLVFKLKVLGIESIGFGAMKALGWLYTIVAVWATVAVARRPLSARDLPLAWLAIVVIASLRSPFLPQAYAAFPAVWLLALLAAADAPTPRRLALVMAGWAALNVLIPNDVASPVTIAVASFVPQMTMIATAVIAVRRVLMLREEAAVPAAVAQAATA